MTPEQKKAWEKFLEDYQKHSIQIQALLEIAFIAGWDAREKTLKRHLEKQAGDNNGVIYYSAIKF